MRILWNNHRDARNPRAGGAERTIQAVGSRLVAWGHDVEVVTAQWRGAPRVEVEDGIRFHRFPGNLAPHLTSSLVARRVHADVTIDDLAHVLPWFSPQLRHGNGVAFFRHLHRRTLPGQVGWPGAPLLSGVERLYPLIYRTWEFAVESPSSRRDLEAMAVRPSSIHEIPPGVDLGRYAPSPASSAPTLVLFTGVRRYKRPDHAVRALALLRRQGVEVSLDVVGGGPLVSELRALARSLGVVPDVRFLGRLTDEALGEVVRSAWVNVNAAVAEGWGYSVLEAAASGVPTAAYDVPGVRDALVGGEAGLVVPDGNVAALAAAIRRLIEENGAWRPRCRRFAEQYPWETCARRWESLLRAVAES
jgi:glycosyltransferase involved in cell wall biosynthesis